MGVDLGEKRTGIAFSDLTGTLAGGTETVKVSGLTDAAEKVAERADAAGASVIVVGKPLNMNGTEGASAQRVKLFAEFLAERTAAEIVLFDERCTTSLAHVYMNSTGISGRKRKSVVDMLSAQIILQNYLDANKR